MILHTIQAMQIACKLYSFFLTLFSIVFLNSGVVFLEKNDVNLESDNLVLTQEEIQQKALKLKLTPYIGQLKQIEVKIGDETRPFLFDTGGGLTLVDPSIQYLSHCQPYGQIIGHRMSGEQVKFKQCGQTDLNIGGLTINADLNSFDLMKLLPREFPTLYGVISLHTFQEQAITLDLGNNIVVVETKQSLQQRIKNMHSMGMRIDRSMEGRNVDVYLEVKAKKGSIWLLLDSGNLSGFILSSHAAGQLELKLNDADEEKSTHLNTQKSESKKALIKVKHNIKMEFIGLQETSVSVIIKDIIHDGVISAKFMEKLIITIDLKTNRVWGRFKN